MISMRTSTGLCFGVPILSGSPRPTAVLNYTKGTENIMNYYEPLYMDENYKHVTRLKARIRMSRIPMVEYAIVLSKGQDQLEIIKGAILRQRLYPRKGLFVVGISKSYDGALLLVQKILEDTYQKTGGYDMKAYLSGRN